MRSLTHRQRILKALNHEEPDRVPIDFGSTGNTGITSYSYDNLKKYLGINTETNILLKYMKLVEVEEEILKRFDVDTRGIWTGCDDIWEDILFPDGSYQDEWGVIRYKSPTSHFYEIVKSPFKEGLSSNAIDRFMWPDPNNKGRIMGIKEKVKYLRENTDYAVVLYVMGGFTTLSQSMRGLEGWLEDILLEPELVGELLDRTLAYQMGLTTAALKDANCDVDVVHFGDDLGTQNGLMISPETYRKIIKPRQAKLFENVRNNSNAKILYHSCGSNYEVFNDLIEIGMDAYNPVQHNTWKMDCKTLKEEFGSKVTFWGGIDTNYVLPRGSTDEVAEEVKKRISILAPGGGYVLNSVHNIQPEVPPENICAMFDAARKYGRYPIKES